MNDLDLNSLKQNAAPISAPAQEITPLPIARLRWIRIFQSLWVVAAILALIVLMASLTGYSVWLQGQSPITPGPDSFSGFYVLSGVTSLTSALLSLGLGLLLFIRKRQEPMSLFVSFYVLIYGVVMSGPLENLSPLIPGVLDLATGVIQPLLLSAPTIWLIILLPDGRPVPAWSRWVGLLSIASLGLLPFVGAASISAFNTLPAQLLYAVWGVIYLFAFVAQIYRYRRISTPTQREQTRWIVFGLAIWFLLLIVQTVPYVILGNLPAGTALPDWAAASAALWWLATSIIPVSLSIAILRHRLYDIDLIINRTLVYGPLTAVLAGLYSASISLFQKVFIALTGEKSDAAIVLTTLILASTFTPIKTRLQALVDRRFKDVHDPLRLLSEFSKQIENGIWVIDYQLALKRLLEEAIAAFDAVGGEIYWIEDGVEHVIATLGQWTGEARLTVPLVTDGKVKGKIDLGRRKNDSIYAPEDTEALLSVAGAISKALVPTKTIGSHL